MKQDMRDAFYERFRSLLLPDETQEEMGKRLGLTRNTIAQYYNRKRVPDAPTLYKICDACNVSADWLLGLSDVKIPDADVQAVSKYTGLTPEALDSLKAMNLQVLNCILAHSETADQFKKMLTQIREAYEQDAIKDYVLEMPPKLNELLFDTVDVHRLLAGRCIEKITTQIIDMDDPFDGPLTDRR